MQQNVQEIQGLYGDFSVSERLLQKIWLRQDAAFLGAITCSGKKIEVLHVGRWNHGAGPDFKAAHLRIDGLSVQGDIEVHFYESDWQAHGHHRDANFDQVMLHILLFPPKAQTQAAQTLGGRQPECLVLLSLLDGDLEAYASDEALRDLESMQHPDWMGYLLNQSPASCWQQIRTAAQARWQQKVNFARKRLESTNWSEACHQLCLEVLGYRHNRAVMGRLALRYPFAGLRVDSNAAEVWFAAFSQDWVTVGMRPSNQPKLRLQQYQHLLLRSPDWPLALQKILGDCPTFSADLSTRQFRQAAQLAKLMQLIAIELMGATIPRGKLDAIICDAMLPLAEAAGLLDAYLYWLHWPHANCPEGILNCVRKTQLTNREYPLSNGMVQGVLAFAMCH